MKKTLKVLGLLAVAATLFVGCKNNTDEGSGEKNIQEALFDPTDLTVDATTFKSADGEWTYRRINEGKDMVAAEQVEYTITKGKWDASKATTYIDSIVGTIPAGTTDEVKEAYKAMGYKIEGDKGSFYKEYDILALTEKYSSDAEFAAKVVAAADKGGKIEDPEVNAYVTCLKIFNKLEDGESVPTGTKTNDDNSKYYCKEEKPNSNGTKTIITTYVAKN